MNVFWENVRQLMDRVLVRAADISGNMGSFFSHYEMLTEIYTMLARWIFPILAVLIVVRCLLPLLQERKSSTVWG